MLLVVIAPVVLGRLPFNIHRLLGSPIGQTAMTLQHIIWPTATLLAPIGYFSAPFLESAVVQRGIEDFKRATWGATYGGVHSPPLPRPGARWPASAIACAVLDSTA